MAGRSNLRGTVFQKNVPRSKSGNTVGQGQFSIYLPRRVDAEYYVRSPVKVKAEMLLSPEHLGGRNLGSIPCRAKAEKLTFENGLSVVNCPIKIEAELLLTPGMSFSCKSVSPESPTPHSSEDSLTDKKPVQIADSWEQWGKKMKAALSKYRSTYGVKSGDMWETKQVLVSELRLDSNSARTKELTKRINSYSSQVSEQNKRIRLLQAKLREEEDSRAESSSKFWVAEQHCKLLERKLKAAESRAMGAEHQAEAIKDRTRDLGVVCEHQGVQLKALAKQVEFFAKKIATQKVAALDTYKALEQRLLVETEFDQEPSMYARATSSETHGSTIVRENNGSFRIHTPLVEIHPGNLLCQTAAIQKQGSSQCVLYPCSSSSRGFRHRLMTPMSEPRANSECTELESSPLHAGLLFNQLMQVAPNWHVEFNSSMQRAEDLIHQCAIQASRLKDLSLELDCLGTKCKWGRRFVPKLIDPQTYDIYTDPLESSPLVERPIFSTPQVTPKRGLDSIQKPSSSNLTVRQTLEFVENPVIKFKITPDPTQESVGNPSSTKLKEQTVESISGLENEELKAQILPISPEFCAMDTENEMEFLDEKVNDSLNVSSRKSRHLAPVCSSHSHGQMGRQTIVHRASLPFRYELRMWRIAARTLIQALLLWFGFRLLPQMQLFRFFPPAT